MQNTNGHYNNIFNKKNIEFELDGVHKTLPYSKPTDVSLQAYQIIFSSVNNSFQKLLDNDLYNEALLKKYIDYGIVGGPSYVKSLDEIIENGVAYKKYVVSGNDGLSILQKEVEDVSNTLSGRYLDGIKVNKLEFQNGIFYACTENGIYTSADKTNWNRVAGEDGIDVVDVCYNHNFLIEANYVSSFDYIAVANSAGSIQFYGHDNFNGTWTDFSKSSDLSSIKIENEVATFVKTYNNDPKLYVGTRKHGLFSSTLKKERTFNVEYGTENLEVNDSTEIPDAIDSYERYFLATSKGIKQLKRMYGFEGLTKKFDANDYVNDAIKLGNVYYVATGNGLAIVSESSHVLVDGLNGINCNSLLLNDSQVYVGTTNNGVRVVDSNTRSVIAESLYGKTIIQLAKVLSKTFAATSNELFFTTNGVFWEKFNLSLGENEKIIQLKTNGNRLYIVTNEAVHVIVSGESGQKTLFAFNIEKTSSVSNSKNVYFAKTVHGGKTIYQIDNCIQVGSSKIECSDLTGNNRIIDAVLGSNQNEYYFLNSKSDGTFLYRLLKNNSVPTGWIVNAVKNEDSAISAIKACYTQKGLAYIGDENKIFILQDNYPTIVSNRSFKDIISFNSSIYAMASNSHDVFRFDFEEDVPKLNRISDLSTYSNIVCFENNEGSTALIQKNSNIDTDPYLNSTNVSISAFNDEIDFELQNPLFSEISTCSLLSSFESIDFIGYLNNGRAKTNYVLYGKDNGLSAISNVEFAEDNDNSVKITCGTASPVSEISSKPNAFADFCYRDSDGLKNLRNSVNIVAANDGLYEVSATKNFVKQIDGVSINCTLSDENEKTFVGTSNGLFVFNPKLESNLSNGNYRNSEIHSIFKRNGTLFAVGNNEAILLSSHTNDLNWNNVFENYFGNELDNVVSHDGCVLSARLETLSKEDDYRSDGVSSIFDDGYVVLNSNLSDLHNLSTLYEQNGRIIATWTDGTANYIDGINEETCEVLFGDEVKNPLTIEQIIAEKATNSYTVSDKLSTCSTMSGSLFYQENEISIVLSNTTELVIDSPYIANIVLEQKTSHVLNSKMSYIGIENCMLSGKVNFNSSVGIKSLTITPVIELSATFITSDGDLLSNVVISNQCIVDEDSPQFKVTDPEDLNVLDNQLRPDSTVSCRTYVIISDIELQSGYSLEDATISLSCKEDVVLNNEIGTNKLLPVFEETNDGIYSNPVTVNYGIIYGCYVEGDVGNFFFDGSLLYKINGFTNRTKDETFGLIQLSKVKDNNSFNDLYYFRIGNNFSNYPIRKTILGTHGLDLSSNLTGDGNISKIAIESSQTKDTLYVKRNDNVLYASDSNMFPMFEKIATNIDNIASCRDFSVALSADRLVFFNNKAIQSGYEIELPSEFKTFFTNSNSVFMQCVDGIYCFPHIGKCEKINDFSNTENVFGLCYDESFYGSDVVFCKNSIWTNDLTYDFRNYEKIINGHFVDVKVLQQDDARVNVLAVTPDKAYTITYSGVNETLTRGTPTIIGEGYANIKAAYYFSDVNDLYLIDDNTLRVYSNFNINAKLNSLTERIVPDFIDADVETSIRMYRFNDWKPFIIVDGKAYEVSYCDRFVRHEKELHYSYNLSGFLENNAFSDDRNAYLYSKKSLLKLSSDEDDFTFEKIFYKNFASLADIKCLYSKTFRNSNKEYSLWSIVGRPSALSAIKTDLNSKNEISVSTYSIEGSPIVNSIFTDRYNVYLGTSERSDDVRGGIFSLYDVENSGIDNDDEIKADIDSVKNAHENNFNINSFEFFNYEKDYIMNYSYSKNQINVNEFYSSDSGVANSLNEDWEENGTAVPILKNLFGKLLYASNAVDFNTVYNYIDDFSKYVSISQLKSINGTTSIFTHVGNGIIGYGNSFYTFDGFSDVKEYGNPNKQYFALLNNFKNGATKILALNDNPDVLVGTNFGLKYVFDGIMSRTFYDKEFAASNYFKVNSIEKIFDPNNNDRYLIGQGNVLFETTNLKDTTFNIIHRFLPDEEILDLISIQPNEYVIATNNGIYLTSLKYKLIDDLRRITIEKVYDIVNEELAKVISEHVSLKHAHNSLITKLNEKADTTLSFINDEDKHSDVCFYNRANAVRVIENDIIDTITYGGQSENDESYIRVGIQNWALGNLDPESTYADDGFINAFTDSSSGKRFNISTVPYVFKKWKSGLKEIYIYVPTTGTYYADNPQGLANTQQSNVSYFRQNVVNSNLLNSLPDACTILRVYLYNSYFKIKTILAAQCTGNSLPLKIYKDSTNADDAWKGVFNTVIQPSALRSLPRTRTNVNNVSVCTDDLERIYLDFSIYGTDAQAIRIIAES